MSSHNMPFEEAMNKVGFGVYGLMATALTGLTMIAYSSVIYGATFIVPTSACDLGTTLHQQGILVAGPMAGLLLGSMVWSYFADKRGRRSMILIALILSALVNTIGTISVNWIMLLICQFLAALLQGVLALLAIPIIPLRFSYYLPSLGIYWNSWRLLMLMFAVPHVIAAICYYFIQESPKFVLTKGDEAKTLEILETIYYINKKSNHSELQVKSLLTDEVNVNDKSTTRQKASLFRMPLLKHLLIMIALNIAQQLPSFVMWLPKIADNFVRILQTADKTDLTMCQVLNMESPHTNVDTTPCALNVTSLLMVLGVSVLQAVCNLCTTFLIDIVGRRNMVMAIYLLCGLSGILVNLVPNIIASTVLFTFMLMGVLIVGLCTSICVELFPTHLRAQAISITMTAQYIAIVISIQVLNLLLLNHCDLGFYLYSSLFASAAIVTAFLPNDRQAPKMPTEITDAGAENLRHLIE